MFAKRAKKMSKIVRETQAKLSHKNIHIETKIKMVHRLRAGVNAAKLRPRRAQEIPSKSQMERVHKHMTGIKVWMTPKKAKSKQATREKARKEVVTTQSPKELLKKTLRRERAMKQKRDSKNGLNKTTPPGFVKNVAYLKVFATKIAPQLKSPKVQHLGVLGMLLRAMASQSTASPVKQYLTLMQGLSLKFKKGVPGYILKHVHHALKGPGLFHKTIRKHRIIITISPTKIGLTRSFPLLGCLRVPLTNSFLKKVHIWNAP